MNNEIGIFKLLGVGRNDDVEGVDSFKINTLLVLVPDYFRDSAPIKQDVVDDRNNLFLEVGTLTHLVIKPTLG